jgi:uncharacterized protein
LSAESESRTFPETIDVDALVSAGWGPSPFTEFVLKVHSRCNLACDYCYMYTMADQSWHEQPVKMSDEIIDYAVDRISQHVQQNQLASVRIILHGGEPLLVGPDSLSRIVERLRARMPSSSVVSISLQTNGLLLKENLRLLNRLGVQVGVSLDGAAADHDRHRKFRNARGSHSAVVSGLMALSSEDYRHLFRGVLCTIDLSSNPLSTYEHLLQFGPPAIDFLLPHRNWASEPQRHGLDGGETWYADWLIPLFDYWYDEPTPRTQIRLFRTIMDLLLGGQSQVEGLGLAPLRTVVIEADGAIQQSDFLKSAYHGAGRTGLRIQDHTLDAALYSPRIAERQIGALALASTCRICRLHRVCGGGHFAHRYRPGFGFGNPSIYCADLSLLIRHINSRMTADIVRLRMRR